MGFRPVRLPVCLASPWLRFHIPLVKTGWTVFRQLLELITRNSCPRHPEVSQEPYSLWDDDGSSIDQPEHSRSRSLITCESRASHRCNSSNRSACKSRSWLSRVWRRSSWWCSLCKSENFPVALRLRILCACKASALTTAPSSAGSSGSSRVCAASVPSRE
jgi:hypothetical protein